MSPGGTRSYRSHDGPVPDLVRDAVANAERLDFGLCVRPETGRLLAVLAAGVPSGGRIGETGTGAGLAWMATSARPDVSLVSIELDDDRAEAATSLFVGRPNVEVIAGDSRTILDHGPFDLLVLDGGPGSGKGNDTPIDPSNALVSGGTLTVDDFTPMTTWPPLFQGEQDWARIHWLDHSELHSTGIRLGDDLSVLVCRRRNSD